MSFALGFNLSGTNPFQLGVGKVQGLRFYWTPQTLLLIDNCGMTGQKFWPISQNVNSYLT